MARTRPSSFNQQVFQLLGLGWAGENSARLAPFIAAVIAKQQADGGWAQLEGLPSDAWATGAALVALNTIGGVGAAERAFQEGLRYLLRTQFEDGSWYVRSRAWPFQPHFESEFPHGKDQWISASGAAWATMALLLTQPTVASARAPDWMALEVPAPAPPAAADANPLAAAGAGKHTVDSARDIAPLLDRSCAACHGGDRKKGGFSILSREAILKGGHSGGPALRSGNSAASQLVRQARAVSGAHQGGSGHIENVDRRGAALAAGRAGITRAVTKGNPL